MRRIRDNNLSGLKFNVFWIRRPARFRVPHQPCRIFFAYFTVIHYLMPMFPVLNCPEKLVCGAAVALCLKCSMVQGTHLPCFFEDAKPATLCQATLLSRLIESGFSFNTLTFRMEKPMIFPSSSTFSITASFCVSLKYPAFFSKRTSR